MGDRIGAPLYEDLKNHAKKTKNNYGSSSHQPIRLDDDNKPSEGADGQGTVPKRTRHVMGNKWDKERLVCDGATSKLSATWTYIFYNKGVTLMKMQKKREDRRMSGTCSSWMCKKRG